MTLPMPAVLTAEEEVTLRRVAYGQSEVRAMRRHDLARLRGLRLIEDGKNGPELTAAGRERFESLLKSTSSDASARHDELMAAIDRRIPPRRR